MPNLKLYVDQTVWPARADALTKELGPLRDLLCRELSVPVSACQLGIVPVIGLDAQPALNAELSILPRQDRTREKLEGLAAELRAQITSCIGGEKVAVRISQLDVGTYIALK